MRLLFRKFAVSYALVKPHRKPSPPRQSGRLLRLVFMAMVVAAGGCSGPDSSPPHEAVLIRTDQQTITQAQFERAFETARIAYSDDRSVDRAALQNARLRLLNQMAEELIIDRRAQELGIVLEDAELETAIREIQSDYPDDTFDQMLLESAIPFSLWKDRLRVRLLMEKVVDRELVQPLTITAQDIEGYFKANEKELASKTGNAPEMDLERHIVEQLRREKVEAAYPQWMDGLRQRYQVEINWELWEQYHHPDAR